PLAAIRSLLAEQPKSDLNAHIEHQVERMNDIVRYQLRKPAHYAAEGFRFAGVAIEEELRRLVDALAKVYKDKEPRIVIDVSEGVVFRGDSGDFLELAGNLLDNACKWCRKEVAITVRPESAGSAKGTGLELTVTDDGPGIPDDAAEQLL